MHKVQFHPDVAIEIKASYDWYQHQAYGLDDNFITELEAAYQAVSELPNTWPNFQKGFRRFQLSKFPFSIIYRAKDESVYVVAVMHNSRKPDY